MHQQLAGVEHLPPVCISPTVIHTAIGTHHVSIPTDFARPVIMQILFTTRSPFAFRRIQDTNIIGIRSLEIPPVVVVSFGFTLRTMALHAYSATGAV